MNKTQLSLILGLYLLFTIPAFAVGNWSVTIAEDPVTHTVACLLESRTHTIDDGQTDTPVKLIFNGKQVYATTKSDIDISYPEIGLTIDKHDAHQFSKVHKNNIAIFASTAESIHKEFIAGKNAKLALGFWPTWPKTQTRIINFDLIGYTKAHQQFEECQKTGNLP